MFYKIAASFREQVLQKYCVIASDDHVIEDMEQIRDKVDSKVGSEDAEDSYLRVVWEKQATLEPQKLSAIYHGDFGDFSGGAFYVGDPDFWYKQLCHDYGRSGVAHVAEIKTIDGDFVTDDVSYMIPPEMGTRGFSKILVTSRSTLHEGKDFTYVYDIGISEDKAEKMLKEWVKEIIQDLLSDKNVVKKAKENKLTTRNLKRYALDYLAIQAPDENLSIDDLDWDNILWEVEDKVMETETD